MKGGRDERWGDCGRGRERGGRSGRGPESLMRRAGGEGRGGRQGLRRHGEGRCGYGGEAVVKGKQEVGQEAEVCGGDDREERVGREREAYSWRGGGYEKRGGGGAAEGLGRGGSGTGGERGGSRDLVLRDGR